MLPYFTEVFGNPASTRHTFGRDAHAAVETSREVLGRALNAKPQDVCFTSGATESLNLAIKGSYLANRRRQQHYITVCTEHKAVLDSFRWIEAEGALVTYLPVDKNGMLDPGQVANAIKPETVMVSVMAANNEIGVIQPLQKIGAICRSRGIVFMTDATQALGKIPLDVEEMSVDLLACSAHKVYGPKGIGALYCRRSAPRVDLTPIIDGGGHERGLRSGTLNVPGIVGFAKAVDLATREMRREGTRLKALRGSLVEALRNLIPEVTLNGALEPRLPGNLNIRIAGVESQALIIALADSIAVSTGSACTSSAVEPSHVLKALGLADQEVRCSIRFGLGRTTTSDQIEFAARAVADEATRLRMLVRTAG
jgi:cysteine desulfurase